MVVPEEQIGAGAASFFPRSRVHVPKLYVLDWLALLIPFVRFISVHIVGELYGTDIALVLMFPVLWGMRDCHLISRDPSLDKHFPRVLLVLGMLWLFGQIFTDFLRGTTFDNYVRGWSNIAIALIEFYALYILLAGRPKRIVLFALGLAGGGVLAYFVSRTRFGEFYPWKFGYGTSVTWVLVLLATYFTGRRRRCSLSAIGILVFAAALNVYMGYRALGGACFVAGAYLLLTRAIGRRMAGPDGRLYSRYMVVMGVAVVVGVISVFLVYRYAAGSGVLGRGAQQEYEQQSAGKYGLLIGGRSELLVSARAIMDSPLLGYGSWAHSCRYANLLLSLKGQLGYVPMDDDTGCLIPSHSYLFGQWVQAGVLGALFWLWAFTLPARLLTRAYFESERLAPLIAFVSIFLMWNILFSPFNGEQRYITMFFVVVIMSYLPRKRGRFPVFPIHVRS